MKKILIFIFCSLIFISCSLVDYYGKCQVNYDVIYPDTTITYDTIFTYNYCKNRYENSLHEAYVSSSRGTNYIRIGYSTFAKTTCPIRLNSYKTLEKNLDNDYDK